MYFSYMLLLSSLGLATTVQAQDCSAPTGGANMGLSDADILKDTFPDGTKVSFVCNVGYTAAGGTRVSTCTAGIWSPVKMRCDRFNCGSAGEVEHGSIDYSGGTEYTDVIVITCNLGYTLVGASEISCGAEGWTKRLPTCLEVYCDPPPKIEHGSADTDTNIQYSHVVKYTCDQGYTRIGAEYVSCSASGKLSPDPPQCVMVNCPAVDIRFAVWVSGSRPPYGYKATVTHKCIDGYKMIGEATSQCDSNSQWTPELPTCEKILIPTTTTTATTTTITTTKKTVPAQDCDTPTGGHHMGLSDTDRHKDTFPDGTKVSFVCDAHYKADGESGVSICTAGTWSPVKMQCNKGPPLNVVIAAVVGVLVVVLVCCGGLFLYKKKKQGTRKDTKEAANEGERVALS